MTSECCQVSLRFTNFSAACRFPRWQLLVRTLGSSFASDFFWFLEHHCLFFPKLCSLATLSAFSFLPHDAEVSLREPGKYETVISQGDPANTSRQREGRQDKLTSPPLHQQPPLIHTNLHPKKHLFARFHEAHGKLSQGFAVYKLMPGLHL